MATTQPHVLVVGGGPGGSTAATLIAREGFKVTLVEQQGMPRYHIGESLLPSCLRIFDLLGVRESVERHGFQRKDGALFDWGPQKWEVDFGGPAAYLYGFQVVRSEFDRLLLDHARGEGVEVLEQVKVVDIRFRGDRPVAAELADRDGRTWTLPFELLVDASGRAGLMANRYLSNRRFNAAFENVATWGYWRNAKSLPSAPFGAIATCSIDCGWVWAIPLHTGTLSVGVVLRKSKFRELGRHFAIDDVYRDLIATNATVSDLIDGAELIEPLRTETDYSYCAEHFAGPGYFIVGDAACFLDPLLSTGVHLATFSALVAAASISSILRNEISEGDAVQFFNASYRRAYMRMLVVVSAFYQTHRGKDSYFREAQKLTAHDYSNVDVQDAFRHIISGTEDLKDVAATDGGSLLNSLIELYKSHFDFVGQRDRWNELPLEEIMRARTRTQFVNAVQEDFSLTPETSIDDWYVSAEPGKIGLRQASRSEGAGPDPIQRTPLPG